MSNPSYVAENDDSRLMAYVGNWKACPSPQQIRQYSHIIVAQAESYKRGPIKNICDDQCNIGSTVHVCGSDTDQDPVNDWSQQGKKVILSFGGAGMGTHWSASQNNCWDDCFGREEELANRLVGMVEMQGFAGISVDYPYCYDVNRTQYGQCARRTDLYTDEKAQFFLSTLTSKLRTKLDKLQVQTNRHVRYELSHKVLDIDLLPESKYFQILQERKADLDYLLPRFYNGISQPGIHGVFGGSAAAGDIYASLVNDIFDGDAHKVRL